MDLTAKDITLSFLGTKKIILFLDAIVIVGFAYLIQHIFLNATRTAAILIAQNNITLNLMSLAIFIFFVITSFLLILIFLYDILMIELKRFSCKNIFRYTETIFIKNSVGLFFTILVTTALILSTIEVLFNIRIVVSELQTHHHWIGLFLMVMYFEILKRHKDLNEEELK